MTMHSPRSLRRATALIAAALAATALAGCSASASTAGASSCAKTITVEPDYKIPVCGDLHLAVFLPGTNNADLQSRIAYLKEAVPAIHGATMTIFDGKFDATTQLNQIDNAIQSGQYNAAIAAPVDGVLMCDALSKKAPAAGMLVVIPNLAICGLTAEEGDALAAPGTLAYVGGTESPGYWTDYLSWISEHDTTEQKFLALTDPAAPFPLTANFETAVKRVEKAHPGFTIVGQAATDLTVAGSFAKAQALLQAHPEATGIITMYSTETQGAIQAMQALGRSGLTVYDKGSTKYAVDQLKAGVVTATSPERAVTSTKAALDAILAARAGKKVDRFIGNDGAPIPADAPKSGFTVFTKDTLGGFAPEN